MKRSLNITFINPNTEEEIVQVLATNIAYSLSEVNKTLKFDYSNISSFQNFQKEDIENQNVHKK